MQPFTLSAAQSSTNSSENESESTSLLSDDPHGAHPLLLGHEVSVDEEAFVIDSRQNSVEVCWDITSRLFNKRGSIAASTASPVCPKSNSSFAVLDTPVLFRGTGPSSNDVAGILQNAHPNYSSSRFPLPSGGSTTRPTVDLEEVPSPLHRSFLSCTIPKPSSSCRGTNMAGGDRFAPPIDTGVHPPTTEDWHGLQANGDESAKPYVEECVRSAIEDAGMFVGQDAHSDYLHPKIETEVSAAEYGILRTIYTTEAATQRNRVHRNQVPLLRFLSTSTTPIFLTDKDPPAAIHCPNPLHDVSIDATVLCASYLEAKGFTRTVSVLYQEMAAQSGSPEHVASFQCEAFPNRPKAMMHRGPAQQQQQQQQQRLLLEPAIQRQVSHLLSRLDPVYELPWPLRCFQRRHFPLSRCPIGGAGAGAHHLVASVEYLTEKWVCDCANEVPLKSPLESDFTNMYLITFSSFTTLPYVVSILLRMHQSLSVAHNRGILSLDRTVFLSLRLVSLLCALVQASGIDFPHDTLLLLKEYTELEQDRLSQCAVGSEVSDAEERDELEEDQERQRHDSTAYSSHINALPGDYFAIHLTSSQRAKVSSSWSELHLRVRQALGFVTRSGGVAHGGQDAATAWSQRSLETLDTEFPQIPIRVDYDACTQKYYPPPAPETRAIPRTPAVSAPSESQRFLMTPAVELARQLCLIEQHHYREVRLREYCLTAWSDPYLKILCGKLHSFLSHTAQLAEWISTLILLPDSVSECLQVYQHSVLVSHTLYTMYNHCGAQGVLMGIDAVPVTRSFKRGELDTLSDDVVEKLKTLREGLHPFRPAQRAWSAALDRPCIPMINPFLGDLTRVEELTPTLIKRSQLEKEGAVSSTNGGARGMENTCAESVGIDVVNWTKMTQLGAVLIRLLNYRTLPYVYIEVPEIQEMLRAKRMRRSVEELYLLCNKERG